MPVTAREILERLSQPEYRPVRAKALAKQLGVKKKDRETFERALERLADEGLIHITKSGKVRKPFAAEFVEGVIRRTSSGAGYFLPHDQSLQFGPDPRVYVAAADMLDAHTGDEVLLRLLKRRRRGGQRCGRIEEILERATRTFVGTYSEQNGAGMVLVDGGTITTPVAVGDPGAKGAQPDDKVVIEMLRFPSMTRRGEAVLVKVLGPRGDPGVDLESIVHEFGLRDEFPPEVLEEAREQAELFDEEQIGGRLDLTGETVVTIDPADARDFDDAISLSRLKNGHWRLGVHIADVGHFVPAGSALDREARLRGTSTYLPGRVLPMLPEILSNALASLQQGRLRYTKSVLIEFDAEGTPLNSEFAGSAVRVTRRFAYEEVLPVVKDPERFHGRISARVVALLCDMHELAMVLRARRREGGALELDLPEVKIDFDEAGRVAGAHRATHDESHQIIEEFMLAANIAVAAALDERQVPFLRRAHASPDHRKLRSFAEFVGGLGYRLQQFQSRQALQQLIDRVRGAPAEQAVNYALLRSLKQAEYTALEEGHYALAEENYCHFTSPIRRYPDLTIHRLTAALIEGTPPAAAGEPELFKLGRHCSHTERRAEQAERELIKVKLLTYLAGQIGLELEAIVTGVEPFGFFCQGTELPAEGLVHVTTLPDDHYDYEKTAHCLVGRRSGREYRLGDRVRVAVALVDVDRRLLDFRLVSSSPRPPSGKRGAQSRGRKQRTAQRPRPGRRRR